MSNATTLVDRLTDGTIRVTAGKIEDFVTFVPGLTARIALERAGVPLMEGHSALIGGRVKSLDTVLDPNTWVQRIGMVDNG